MKRLLALLLFLFLLGGCGVAPEPEPPTVESIATQAPTEGPAGLYTPRSELELHTGGAVRVYSLDGDNTHRILPMGNDLLLINNAEQTILTRLSGDGLIPGASAVLDCALFPEDPFLQVGEAGITYYREASREVVFLGPDLTEVSRISIPEDIQGSPAITGDRKKAYYFTGDSLRVLDLETGIDSLLKEICFAYQSITALHCDDTVIECSVSSGEGQWSQMFLSAESGALMAELIDYVTLQTQGDLYFAVHMDGQYEEKLIGRISRGTEDLRMLHCPDRYAAAFPILAQNAIVTATDTGEGFTLDYYDLRDGTHPYSLALLPSGSPWQILPDPGGRHIWILYYNDDLSCDQILRWDLEKSRIEDDTVYIGVRRTGEDPDTFGLSQCAREAEALSEKHGVTVLTWTDATQVQPFDYRLTPEHQVVLTREALQTLDQALSCFPEGFFRQAASEMGDGVLRISLVRGIYGNAEYDTLDSAGGVQFWDNQGNPYVVLQIGYGMEQNLYHELYHVMESRIFSKSAALDQWHALNPEDFSYDYNYANYLNRDDYSLISGDAQAFIDYYAMSYPKEDRARILEYAMMPGYSHCFESQTMQAKLRALCDGIRQAYGLEEADRFRWEQYLPQQ